MRISVWFALAHGLVDMACFHVLMGPVAGSAHDAVLFTTIILLYNGLAFGLQMVMGRTLDLRFRSMRNEGSVAESFLGFMGCLLILTGVLTAGIVLNRTEVLKLSTAQTYGMFIAVSLLGIGNAAFHVGCGAELLRRFPKRRAASGLYISVGALGVLVGTIIGRIYQWPIWGTALLLLLPVLLFAREMVRRNQAEPVFSDIGENKRSQIADLLPVSSYPSELQLPPIRHIPFRTDNSMRSNWVVFLCLMVIVGRAYAGGAMQLVWKNPASLLLFSLPALCAFAGKLAGGFLADAFGDRQVAVSSLLVSIPLLYLWGSSVVPCALGLFMVSMTTSITVCIISESLPGQEGFSFGLTTFALLIGSLPVFFGWVPKSGGVILYAFLTLAAASGLWWATKRMEVQANERIEASSSL